MNIKKLYTYEAALSFVLYYALDKVFMQLRGLSISHIVTVEIIFGLLILGLGVSSGALSDRWSRKNVLALCALALVLNTVIWALATSFLGFLVGVVFGAIAWVLHSGTNTAILYDSLKENGQQNHYEKYLARQRAIGGLSFMIAATLGGIIGQNFGIEATFWWSIPALVLAFFTALSIREPSFHRSTGEVDYFTHIKQTFSFLIAKPKLKVLSQIVTITMAIVLLVDEYIQLYAEFIGLSIAAIGIVGAIDGLNFSLSNLAAEPLGKRFKHQHLYGVLLLLMVLGLLLAVNFVGLIGLISLFVVITAYVIIDVIAMADINHQLTSKIRATSESYISFGSRLIGIPLGFAFAFAVQNIDMAFGFGILGIILLISISYLVVTGRFSLLASADD